MTNTKFNRIWEMANEIGHVKFFDHGYPLTLTRVIHRYGCYFSLRDSLNTVLVHYDKERFRELMVD